MRKYIVSYETTHGAYFYFFKSRTKLENVVCGGIYAVVKDANLLKIMETFQIKFEPENGEYFSVTGLSTPFLTIEFDGEQSK